VYPQYFEYDHVAGLYRSLFSADRVLVMPLELLGADRRDYVRRISRFCCATTDVDKIDYSVVKRGIPANIGSRRLANAFLSSNPDNPFRYLMPTPAYWRGARYVKRLIEHMGRNFDDDKSLKAFHRRLERLLGDRYAESNRRLAGMMEVNLSRLGYKVGRDDTGPVRDLAA
jgi:hypothetical protein